MLHSDLIEHVQIIRDIKNIDEPTKASIADYINHGFGKIDGYLKPVIDKTDAATKLKVQLEKKGNDNYIGGLHFNFPGVLDDFYVKIDENTPQANLVNAVSELFEKAKNALQKQVDKLHDKHE
ncbi:MAG: hypothetical protein WC004_04165 [Candidatus Absconditabacterales bacterium]